MEITVTIMLSLSGEKTLRETNWQVDSPELPGYTDIDDLIRTGLLYRTETGSIHLTDIGEDILTQLS